MDRSVVYERDGEVCARNLVDIGGRQNYKTRISRSGWSLVFLIPERKWCPSLYIRSSFTSNFARDPAIRSEFLNEYLNKVQFHWAQRWKQAFMQEIDGLPQFLSMIATENLNGAFRHLTIHPPWSISLVGPPLPEGEVVWLGRVFSTLCHYETKCELNFLFTSRSLIPLFNRIVEISKTKFLRSHHVEHPNSQRSYPPLPKIDKKTLELFLEDTVLRVLMRDFREANAAGGVRTRPHSLKYLVDFSK